MIEQAVNFRAFGCDAARTYGCASRHAVVQLWRAVVLPQEAKDSPETVEPRIPCGGRVLMTTCGVHDFLYVCSAQFWRLLRACRADEGLEDDSLVCVCRAAFDVLRAENAGDCFPRAFGFGCAASFIAASCSSAARSELNDLRSLRPLRSRQSAKYFPFFSNMPVAPLRWCH